MTSNLGPFIKDVNKILEFFTLSPMSTFTTPLVDIYFVWADFNTVPGAPTGFFQGRAIGGGRGQWFGGHHGECGAPAYNGGLGNGGLTMMPMMPWHEFPR